MIKLIGIFIIIVGFMLKFNTIGVVILAGIVTGLVSQMDFMTILSTFGEAFVHTRYMSLFLITLPVIGILERNGLKNTASRMIAKINKATVSNILSFFMIIRTTMSILGIRISGHIHFVRPVLYPMLESKARSKKQLNTPQEDLLKSAACAMENYGNFYGQNLFIASPGVLLIIGTLEGFGIKILNVKIALISAIPAIFMIIFVIIQNKIITKNIMERK